MMILKGFRFGMLLQLAIGPVCLFLFQTAALKGFYPAMTGVLGVLIIDGLYIMAAILGIAAIIERGNIKTVLKATGAGILFVFGISTVLSVFNISFLPGLSLQHSSNASSVLGRTVLLTASNPLTIIFWAGVFSMKIAEEEMAQKEINAFGFGALLSTVFFLALVALAGSFTRTFLPVFIIQILNLIVGLLLIYFGIRMFFKR